MNTPAHAPPSDPTAVFGRRTLAFLIDVVIGLAIAIAVFAAVAESAEFESNERAEEVCDDFNDTTNHVCINAGTTVILAEDDDIAVVGLSALAWGLLSMLVIPTITGGSPGKLLVGLRVVDKDSFAKAGFGKHLVRWILWIVDTAPWFCGIPLVGLITGLASKGHRRVGDMAAGTFVVDKKLVDRPVAVPGANDVVGAYASAASPSAPPPPTGPPVSPPAPTTAAPTGPPTSPPADEPAAPGPDDFGHEPAAPGPDAAAPPTAPAPDSALAPDPAPGPEPATESPPPTPETPPAPQPPPAAPRPGIDTPQWDPARGTYIQWDPELEEWMEWSEAAGRWVPISR